MLSGGPAAAHEHAIGMGEVLSGRHLAQKLGVGAHGEVGQAMKILSL